MRLHVVRHPVEEPSGPRKPPAETVYPRSGGAVSDRVSPDHPSVDHPDGPRDRTADPATIRPIGSGPSTGSTRPPARATDNTWPTHDSERRVITSAATTQTSSPFRGSDGWSRPTPYESGLAAVARHDVHIERVWPMRSPSTGSLEASSSAYFQRDRRGTPPANIVPVGGLRMNQTFPHEPVMAEEVVGLLAPVPPGLILDSTLGGGGHAAAILSAHPEVSVLGIDRDPAAVAAASEVLAPFEGRAVIRQSRFDALAQVVADVQAQSGTPLAERGLSGALFDLGVSSPSSTWPSGGSPTAGMPCST